MRQKDGGDSSVLLEKFLKVPDVARRIDEQICGRFGSCSGFGTLHQSGPHVASFIRELRHFENRIGGRTTMRFLVLGMVDAFPACCRQWQAAA